MFECKCIPRYNQKNKIYSNNCDMRFVCCNMCQQLIYATDTIPDTHLLQHKINMTTKLKNEQANKSNSSIIDNHKTKTTQINTTILKCLQKTNWKTKHKCPCCKYTNPIRQTLIGHIHEEHG